jgi:hypothetical protein
VTVDNKQVAEGNVERFDAMIYPDKYLEYLRSFPDLTIDQRKGLMTEGPRCEFQAGSMEEIMERLSTKKSPFRFHIIHLKGICHPCAKDGKLCEHLGKTIPSTCEITIYEKPPKS